MEIIPLVTNETEYYITNIETEERSKRDLNNSIANIDVKFAHITARRVSDEKEITTTTHFGHILKHGDTVVGFDLTTLN